MSQLEIRFPDIKAARDTLRQEKRCINGPRDPSTRVGYRGIVHGDVVRGGKCQRCLDVHAGKLRTNLARLTEAEIAERKAARKAAKKAARKPRRIPAAPSPSPSITIVASFQLGEAA